MLQLFRSCKLVWLIVANTLAQPKMPWGLHLPVPSFSLQVCISLLNRDIFYLFPLLFLYPFSHSTHCRVVRECGHDVVRCVKFDGEICHAFLFAEHLQPPFFDIKPVSIDAALGESATFKCHVTGSAPMRIVWTRDNREIRPGGNYKMMLVENTASLVVLKVGKGDAGLYTCTASNSVGKDACAAQLAVQGTAGRL